MSQYMNGMTAQERIARLEAALLDAAKDLIEHKFISAIKAYRALTGLGLRESKNWADARKDELATSQQPSLDTRVVVNSPLLERVRDAEAAILTLRDRVNKLDVQMDDAFNKVSQSYYLPRLEAMQAQINTLGLKVRKAKKAKKAPAFGDSFVG